MPAIQKLVFDMVVDHGETILFFLLDIIKSSNTYKPTSIKLSSSLPKPPDDGIPMIERFYYSHKDSSGTSLEFHSSRITSHNYPTDACWVGTILINHLYLENLQEFTCDVLEPPTSRWWKGMLGEATSLTVLEVHRLSKLEGLCSALTPTRSTNTSSETTAHNTEDANINCSEDSSTAVLLPSLSELRFIDSGLDDHVLEVSGQFASHDSEAHVHLERCLASRREFSCKDLLITVPGPCSLGVNSTTIAQEDGIERILSGRL
jgi:hypothetical protein